MKFLWIALLVLAGLPSASSKSRVPPGLVAGLKAYEAVRTPPFANARVCAKRWARTKAADRPPPNCIYPASWRGVIASYAKKSQLLVASGIAEPYSSTQTISIKVLSMEGKTELGETFTVSLGAESADPWEADRAIWAHLAEFQRIGFRPVKNLISRTAGRVGDWGPLPTLVTVPTRNGKREVMLYVRPAPSDIYLDSVGTDNKRGTPFAAVPKTFRGKPVKAGITQVVRVGPWFIVTVRLRGPNDGFDVTRLSITKAL